ncbi:unnamed protein product, partial [Ceratitis capitata]
YTSQPKSKYKGCDMQKTLSDAKVFCEGNECHSRIGANSHLQFGNRSSTEMVRICRDSEAMLESLPYMRWFWNTSSASLTLTIVVTIKCAAHSLNLCIVIGLTGSGGHKLYYYLSIRVHTVRILLAPQNPCRFGDFGNFNPSKF